MARKNWTFSPSLMCMSFLQIAHDVEILNRHFQSLHVDISDGHFCKSILLSPNYVKDIKQITTLPIEVHLMVENPNDYIDDLVDAGANTIIVHVESINRDAFRTINRIRSRGVKVGIALCPETPLSYIMPLLRYVDIVSILNVDIGFAGQPLIAEMLDRTKMLAEIKKHRQYNFVIQSDGGVTDSTYHALTTAGTECFVLGNNALFSKSHDLEDACRTMKSNFNREIGGMTK